MTHPSKSRPQGQPPASGKPAWLTPRTQLWVGTLILAVVPLVVYLPALGSGFILDDDVLLTGNRIIKSPDGLYRIWLTTEAYDYWPVTNTMFWFEWRLWGIH